ncbi:MAG: nitroreductase family deazaflavin-dependent oxidoreductase [Pseudonocardia sp.]|uniref:nitroreductase family deazaflavin-dependent oxidoreductase n=1 Tax=unclassified Pseudonocardia TaxID=2619320 RepID=UPI001AD04BA1|nr:MULTISPECIES: nitroreductase family deazaflavin-dependent oxidoreductase [unclassified Pseudonocardia]MBN9113624.1 nitroreductase family deazaflavin-dependent oxidoreductase [Pseudonocardia sp.]
MTQDPRREPHTPSAQGRARQNRAPRLPTWLRVAFSLPRVLYRHGLGRLLGSRFLLLSHRGRRSGRPYANVLEVVHHDPLSGEYVVVSGLGHRSDWYRNVRAGGPVTVTVGSRCFPVDARELDPDEAVAVLGDYERRNRLLRPIVHRVLSKLVGRPYTGTVDERRALVRDIPLVGLRPTIRTIKT